LSRTAPPRFPPSHFPSVRSPTSDTYTLTLSEEDNEARVWRTCGHPNWRHTALGCAEMVNARLIRTKSVSGGVRG
jgi:hypothetical protein